MQKIFIVEDEDHIRKMISYALAMAGFEAEGFMDGEAFWQALEAHWPSLILLDIMLPGEDGLSILKRLRQSEKYAKIPVILLTAKGTEYDRINGLDLGADDYITKPFSVMEAISRIKAVLRRSGQEPRQTAEIQINGLRLHKDRRTVHAGDREITLTYKEFELLQYLMVNEDIVLSRDKLLEQIWGFDYNGESRTVDMHIKSLRQKLGDSGSIIKTVRNIGYKASGGSEVKS